MMTTEERIKTIHSRLTEALSPTRLQVIDESHLHIGHAAAKEGLGHFVVTIESPCFKGKITLEQHRMIYEAVGDLMPNEVHALRIQVVSS